MTVGTRLYTWVFGEEIGQDSQGNRYFRSRRSGERQRRWVLYKGDVEASRVPPAWHSWLHHTTDTIPEDDIGRQWDWQQEHQPNKTGTPDAYRPAGHVLEGGVRARATGDYEPWEPV